MDLRFRQLQALHAVIDAGTVSAATQILGISQPGISNLLAQLEHQTQLLMFERLRGRLVPTPEALVLYREIDTVVRGMGHVTQTVSDLQNQKVGQVQLTSSHALSFGFLPRVISHFTADKPNLTISFQSQYSRKIQEWVLSGLFEIGICELPIEHNRLNQHFLRYEMRCAVPDGLAMSRKTLTPVILDGVPFIVMGEDHMTHRRTSEAFLQASANWRVRVNTHLFQNKLDFVKQGLGVALIDPFTLLGDDGAGYQLHDFEPKIQLDLALITAKDRPLSQIGKALVEVLLRELRQIK